MCHIEYNEKKCIDIQINLKKRHLPNYTKPI